MGTAKSGGAFAVGLSIQNVLGFVQCVVHKKVNGMNALQAVYKAASCANAATSSARARREAYP